MMNENEQETQRETKEEQSIMIVQNIEEQGRVLGVILSAAVSIHVLFPKTGTSQETTVVHCLHLLTVHSLMIWRDVKIIR